MRLEPLFHGGGHERGLRSGTLNVPGIVGFGEAVRIAVEERSTEARRLRLLRARLDAGIRARVEGVSLNGAPLPSIDGAGELIADESERRLPGNLNLSFAGVEGEALLMDLKELAVSSGSACTSASIEPSHVLQAIGVPTRWPMPRSDSGSGDSPPKRKSISRPARSKRPCAACAK